MRTAILSFGLLLLFAEPVDAAETDPCGGLLVPDVYDFQNDVKIRVAFLQTIDEETYRLIQKSDNQRLKLSLFDLIDADGSGDYGRFDEARSKYFKRIGFRTDYADASSYLIQVVPPERAALYVQCKRNQLSADGLFIWLEESNPENAIVGIRWSPPPGGKQSVRVTATSSGFVEPLPISQTLPDGDSRFLLTKRQDAARQQLVLNGGGYSDKVSISAPEVEEPVGPEWCRNQVEVPLEVSGHLSGIGDVSGSQSSWVGTRWQGRSSQSWRVNFRDIHPNPIDDLGIEIRCHGAGYGWKGWVTQGTWCFDEKLNSQMEAVQLRLTGRESKNFVLRYSCHVQGYGDVGVLEILCQSFNLEKRGLTNEREIRF